MKTVFKYPLELVDIQEVQLPHDAQLLRVSIQNHRPHLWALVDIGNADRGRWVRIAGTGHPIDRVTCYISTFEMHEGSLVFHAFEAPPPISEGGVG